MGLAARATLLSGLPDNDDAPLFIRGVQRYAVAEGRPHWPGYPVYVAIGKLAAALAGGPAFGLQLVSAAASAAVAWPLAWLAFRWSVSVGFPVARAARGAVAAALLWMVIPMSWVTGSQIVSDPLGLLLALMILALAVAGELGGSRRAWIAAAFLGGLLPGVRLVDVTLLGPLAWKAVSARGERWGRLPVPVVLLLALIGGALPWLAGLAVLDARGYVEAGRAHLLGHFTDFGESVWTDRHPSHRPWTALHTLAVYGLGAGGPEHGWPRVVAAAGWIALLALAVAARPWRGPVLRLIAWWAGPSLLYLFLAHDMAYPRYLMTPALLVTLGVGMVVARHSALGEVVAVVTAAAAAAVSLPLARHQRLQPPVEYQAAAYIARRDPGALVLMTRPEILLALYLGEFPGQISALVMPTWSVADWRLNGPGRGRRAYLTVLPPEDAEAWVPIAHFCRDPMIEPIVASELWLFTPGAVDASPALPRCGETR